MILFATDIHADFKKRLGFLEGFLNPSDILFLAGDLELTLQGVIEDSAEFKWLESQKYQIAYIDGNHDNIPWQNAHNEENWNNGKVHRISENIVHLMRGEIYDIPVEEGKTKKMFAMGGALSPRTGHRILGTDWWKEEVPSEEERKKAEENLAKENWCVDLVLTHDCPTFVQNEYEAYYTPDFYTDWLASIAEKTKFEKWIFGHYHESLTYLNFRGLSQSEVMIFNKTT